MANEKSSEWAYFIHYLRNSIGTLGALADYYGGHPPDPVQVKRLLEQLKRVSVQSQGYIAAFSEFTPKLHLTTIAGATACPAIASRRRPRSSSR